MFNKLTTALFRRQHLAERLERRRQLLEYRRLQERQDRDEPSDEVAAFSEPLGKLVEDGKLDEKQKKEILDEHERNLMNLQKQHQLGRKMWGWIISLF